MTLADIDKALAQWESRLASAAHNLFDLQNDGTYQCLTGSGGAPKTPLTGITASRVYPSLENVGALFQCFDLLRSTIDRAVQLRRNMPAIFGAEQKVNEIAQLLTTKSVRIPPNQIPMAQRSLLTGADEQGCISPDELLKSMVKAFEAARDAVIAVEKAWHDLGTRLGDASRQINALRSAREPLEEAERRELDGAEHALGLRRAQVQSDPLGTSLDLDSSLLPAIAHVQNAIAQRVQFRLQTEEALSAARTQFEQLRSLHRDASAAWSEALQKIAPSGQLPAPCPEAKIQSLGEWLDTLQSRFAGGMLAPVSVGLRNWNNAAADCVSDVEKVHAENRSPLDLRRELRGRLNALKAKAQAYGIEEDAGLRSAAAEAEALLYARPTPLDRADQAVTRYQSLVNQFVLKQAQKAK